MILAVCGMASEAALIGQRDGLMTVVGAGDPVGLTEKMEAAIAAGGVDRIISLGTCGALGSLLEPGDVALGVGVRKGPMMGAMIIQTDVDWTRRIYTALSSAIDPPPFYVWHEEFVWSATSVNTVADKVALRSATGADVVDMESWIAASVAYAHRLPFAIVRAVLDPASFGLPPAAQAPLLASGEVDLPAVLASLAADPAQAWALAQLSGWQDTAFKNLGLALATIGDDFSAYATV